MKGYRDAITDIPVERKINATYNSDPDACVRRGSTGVLPKATRTLAGFVAGARIEACSHP
jgi:hypothetical protein